MAILAERTVVRLGEVAYYVASTPEVRLAHRDSRSWTTTTPALVVTASQGDNLDTLLQTRLDYFEKHDDVYSPLFAEHGKIFIQYYDAPSAGQLPDHTRFEELAAGRLIPEGPYFLRGESLHQPWRLYPDTYKAFTLATVPDPTDKLKFEPLQVSAYDGDSRVIAVPSRLYYTKSEELPLNGVRVSIKDNIDLQGVKTTLGNRAFTEFYGPQETTAAYVKELINKGAIVVGKTKLNAFAGSEKPPDQCIDYFAPWNPRADGYLRPAGSSSGAGASIAGYSWLDFSVGTDTTGSVREPARACGVWGIKLTQGILPDDGVQPSCRLIDSFGLFARSAQELREYTRTSLGDRISGNKLPSKIIYPLDWMPQKNEIARQSSEEFLQILEGTLGVKRTEVRLAEEWTRTAPEDVRDIPISEYLKNSGFYPLYYDNYHHYDEFRAAYKDKYGKEVYVSPSQGWKWDLGSKVTPEQRAQGLAELAVYKKWIHEKILTSDENGQPDSIIFLPLGAPVPEYRDKPNKPPSVVPSFEPKYLASVLGLPQIVVPISQIPYESTISKRVENVPVIATFAGPRGADLMLIQTAQLALEKAGISTQVLTGRDAFAPDTFAASPAAKLV